MEPNLHLELQQLQLGSEDCLTLLQLLHRLLLMMMTEYGLIFRCRLSRSSVGGQVLLPLNTYSVVQADDAGSLLLEAGALKADGTRAVSTRYFQDGKCQHIAVGIEQRS